MADFPTGVAVVTTTDLSGRPHGFTCSALCSVTVTPPTLLVCANLHGASLAALLERGLFAVNLLAESAIPTAVRFSSASIERFAGLPWLPGPATGMPLLRDDVCGAAECEVGGAIPVGDHMIVLGSVRAVRSHQDIPLVYGRRCYGRFGSPGSPVDHNRSTSLPRAPAVTVT
jgi:flavin reductase (DIM6/NTAB) family NADH-FMN oxidoreductase RutF